MEFFFLKKIVLGIFLFSLLIFPFVISSSYAHLEHSSSGGVMTGKYFSFIGFEPRNPIPEESTKIIFSIQDKDANDIYDIVTMVEIYSANMEKRLFYEPWTEQKIGDFEIPFVFENKGTYQIVLSISEENIQEHVIPPRQVPSSSSDCNCTRVLFNVSVSENWSNIWNSLMIVVVVLPFSIFGFAMFTNFKNKKKSKQKLSRYEILRYVVMFLAFAGGVIHLSIYVDHAPLRIEYGLFLLLAAISQIGFGVLFLSVLLFDSSTTQKTFRYFYRRNLAVYFFGLIGSAVLIGLYIYAVIYPPPLSPENHPEHIDMAGIIAKSLEVSLIGTIVYILNYERKYKKTISNDY